jgi:hypothetical protein
VHHQCSFGTWLHSEDQSRHAGTTDFEACESVHAELHALADALLDLHTRGRTADALMRLPSLHALRDALLGHLQALIAASIP